MYVTHILILMSSAELIDICGLIWMESWWSKSKPSTGIFTIKLGSMTSSKGSHISLFNVQVHVYSNCKTMALTLKTEQGPCSGQGLAVKSLEWSSSVGPPESLSIMRVVQVLKDSQWFTCVEKLGVLQPREVVFWVLQSFLHSKYWIKLDGSQNLHDQLTCLIQMSVKFKPAWSNLAQILPWRR